jgi:hypothetical protein
MTIKIQVIDQETGSLIERDLTQEELDIWGGNNE